MLSGFSSPAPRPGALELLQATPVLEAAVGAAIAFGSVGVVAYALQQFVRIQGSLIQGRVLEWCAGAGLRPAAAAEVVLVGTAGPAGGAVYEAPVEGGAYWVSVTPGLYAAAVILQDGRQVPPMVLTPKTASGELPLTQSLELIYDVWAQVLAPRSRSVTVDLVVNC